MVKQCFICKSKIHDAEFDEFKLDDNNSRCRKCHIEWLRDNIKHMKNSIYYMDLELKQLLSRCYVWSDDDSDTDSDSDHLYLDNNNI